MVVHLYVIVRLDLFLLRYVYCDDGHNCVYGVETAVCVHILHSLKCPYFCVLMGAINTLHVSVVFCNCLAWWSDSL